MRPVRIMIAIGLFFATTSCADFKMPEGIRSMSVTSPWSGVKYTGTKREDGTTELSVDTSSINVKEVEIVTEK